MPRGDRGEAVKDLQRQLNELGAQLTVDGVWGPLTQSAFEQYESELPQFEGGEADATPEGSVVEAAPGQDYTPDNAQGRFNVIGGNPNIWFNTDTNTYLVVYDVPNSDPPLPVYWEVPDEQTLQAYFGPDVTVTADRDVTNDQLVSYGALGQGMSTEIPETDQDPLMGWAEIYERQAKVRPYLLDPEVVGLIMGAAIEGRPITQAELEGTQWWQSHSETEREWLIKVEADPVTATQTMEANRIRVVQDMMDSGVHQPPEDLVEYLTVQLTTGKWNENILLSQISAIADPSSVHALRPETQTFLDSIGMVDTTRGEEDTVRKKLQKWLGPSYGAWSDAQIAAKAGELRNNPDAELEWEQQLKAQRMALFPTYEDENMSYEDIAAPWRNFAFQQWGEQLDETDPVFNQLLLTNDAIENGKTLTQEGMRRGVNKVTTDLSSQVLRATGGAVQGGRR